MPEDKVIIMNDLKKYQEDLKKENQGLLRLIRNGVSQLGQTLCEESSSKRNLEAKRRKHLYLLIQNAILSLLILPQMYYQLFHHKVDYQDKLLRSTSVRDVLFFLLILTVVAGWGMYFSFIYKDWCPVKFPRLMNLLKDKQLFYIFQAITFISLSLFYGLLVIFRTLTGPCPHRMEYPIDLNCNPYADVPLFPMDSAFVAMSVPIILVVIMKEKRLRVVLCCWVIVVFSLVYSSIVVKSIQSIPIVVGYVCLSVLLIIDGIMVQALALKLIKQVKESMEERQRLADTLKTSEMKDVIGNVAHDLKTVSSYSILS